MSNFLKKLVVTGLGTGYLPIAPGTWGSAAVCVIFLAAAYLSASNCFAVNGVLFALAVFSSIGCVLLGKFTEEAFGKKDPSQCSLDEWAGQAIALLFLPLGEGPRGLLIVTAVGFLAFRIFDIVKPFPARRLEKLNHGWGVLLDDVVAGVYANIAAQLVLRFTPLL